MVRPWGWCGAGEGGTLTDTHRKTICPRPCRLLLWKAPRYTCPSWSTRHPCPREGARAECHLVSPLHRPSSREGVCGPRQEEEGGEFGRRPGSVPRRSQVALQGWLQGVPRHRPALPGMGMTNLIWDSAGCQHTSGSGSRVQLSKVLSDGGRGPFKGPLTP